MPLTLVREQPPSTEAQVPRGSPALQPLPWRRSAPLVSSLALLAADLAAWALAGALVYVLRTSVWGPGPYVWIMALASVGWLLSRGFSKLYPGYGLSPIEELRRTVITTLLAAITHAMLLLAAGEVSGFYFIALFIWLFILPLTRLFRAAAKHLLIRARLFGYPIVVIGAGEKGERAVCALQDNIDLGLLPVAVFTDDAAMQDQRVEGVPVLGSVGDATRYRFPYPVRHAMIALSRQEVGPDGITKLVHRLSRKYPTLQIFPDLQGLATLWARAVPIGEYLSLEIPHARFLRRDARLKRAFDLLLCIPLLLISLPIILVSAGLVKAFSPGPAFFSHTREGRGGRRVKMWKIRTMVPDAEERLAEYLSADPVARFEWQRFVKLRHDPRIVPVVGKFLRRFSIDELPQLWNVIRGEMSLVGPRLFPRYHVERFPHSFRKLRRQVPPGLTGLWQVRYRNNGDLSVQQRADAYYIHNWSLWLDLWILIRTGRIVLTGTGAY